MPHRRSRPSRLLQTALVAILLAGTPEPAAATRFPGAAGTSVAAENPDVAEPRGTGEAPRGTLPRKSGALGAACLVLALIGALAWAASQRRKVHRLTASLRTARTELADRVREHAQARLRAEAAQAETEMRFRTAFRTSPDSININRLEDGLYEDINDGFTEITGYTADEVIGRTSLDIDIWADPGDRATLVEGLRRDGVVRNLEARFRMKGGQVIRGLISARVIELGGVPHILSVARNIEEWAQARESQRDSEARLRSVIESMPFPFFAFDPDGRCTTVNSRARERWGDAVGRAVGEIPGDAQIGSRWQQGFHRALAGETLEDHWEHPAGGRRVAYHSVVAPIAGPDGIMGAQALHIDVTERQELEEQLSHAQKMEAVGTLASGIAHDFNNLLQGILGYTELSVRVPDLPEEARDHLGKIASASRSAADLVRSLLTFSRREKPQLNPLDLNREVETAVALLRRTIPKMVSIETHLARDLEPCLGDARQLEQVLLNLGTNARDAMPDGGVLTYRTATIDLGSEPKRQPPGVPRGRYVLCSVTDTGTGMDEITGQRIFDPFFTTKQIGKGTGLGLSTAYGAVRNHGGFLTCDSVPGEGTRFDLYLPVYRGATAEDARKPAPDRAATRGRGTILVVDDEEAVRNIASTALEDLGYTVWIAESGERALELCRDRWGSLALVLLDLGMPGMGGRRFLERLRELAPDLPVLVASGYGRDAQVQGILEDGATRFLSKPYSLDELARRVAECLGA